MEEYKVVVLKHHINYKKETILEVVFETKILDLKNATCVYECILNNIHKDKFNNLRVELFQVSSNSK